MIGIVKKIIIAKINILSIYKRNKYFDKELPINLILYNQSCNMKSIIIKKNNEMNMNFSLNLAQFELTG